MPEEWSAKRERQYEHIRDSYQERGVSEDEAEERAARTVNKERREAGETKKDRDDQAGRSASQQAAPDDPRVVEQHPVQRVGARATGTERVGVDRLVDQPGIGLFGDGGRQSRIDR